MKEEQGRIFGKRLSSNVVNPWSLGRCTLGVAVGSFR